MAHSNDYPSNLPTNAYILHDFVDIAYIVCMSAPIAVLDKSDDVQETSSKEGILARLETTEQQFRQASILVALDSDKLELFTFYKTVDIVKDQKTILTKFSQVLKLNRCVIAYKNACRVSDILKPDASRIFKLFTTAVLSSVRVQAPPGGRLARIGIDIYIVPSTVTEAGEQPNAVVPRVRYSLHRVDLQITPGGQLLLIIQNALWPTLHLLSDVLVAKQTRLLNKADSTFYLAPTGQLASYRAGWIGSLASTYRELENSKDGTSRDLRCRVRCIEKAQHWITSNSSSSHILDKDSIWIEVGIPALVKTAETNDEERALVWKSIYWPAQMSYMFSKRQISISNTIDYTTMRDPLRAAEDWLLNGAVQAQELWNESQRVLQLSSETEGRLFDDDIHFDSPQQFASFPLQGIPNSQTVYPTPPDVMTAQATPGFAMIDGMVQTPATLQHLQSSIHQSSPLASGVQQSTSADVNMSKPLSHGDEEDLFEEIDDQKLNPTSFADEPNWDFFDRGSPEETLKIDHTDKPKEELNTDVIVSPVDVQMTGQHDQSIELRLGAAELNESHDDDMQTDHLKVSSPQITVLSPNITENFAAHLPNTSIADEDRVATLVLSQVKSQHGKRRRSSAYEAEADEKRERDLKYSANGKYWFNSKKQSALDVRPHIDSTPVRRTSSDSSSSCISSQSRSGTDEDEDSTRIRKPWAQYAEIQNSHNRRNETEEQFSMMEYDMDIDHLLHLISMATGEEPFTTPTPDGLRPRMPRFDDPDRCSRVIQVLNEHIAQSALFAKLEPLDLPEVCQLPMMELTFDNAGSNTTLSSAAMSDLMALPSAAQQVKGISKILSLDHGRIRLLQADNRITADLSILRYWELLNLQPLNGKKNLSAICIYPDNEYYFEGCRALLRRLGETYSNCNLGTHSSMTLSDVVHAGLASWQSWPNTDNLLSLCQTIGRMLGKHDNERTCTIIYMVLPDGDLTYSYAMCDAFVELLESFMENRTSTKRNVALQFVPGSFVVDPNSPKVPSEDQYIGLALEVYARALELNGTNLPAVSKPAFTVEKTVGPIIHFELDSKVTSPVRRHGDCCHLAYSISTDGNWLVATWSDSIGIIALTMAYHLMDKQEKLSNSRLEIFKHLSKVSMQIMGRQKYQWWLAIAKAGAYEMEELQEWLHVCGQLSEEQELLTRVVLLSVELQPKIHPHGSGSILRPASTHVVNSSNTPATTPQATTSPDQTVSFTPSSNTNIATMAQTPPESNTEAAGEHEVYLVDPLEDSWTAILPFGVNLAQRPLDVRPALATGYLLKRIYTEGKDSNNTAALAVHLIAVTRKPATPLMPQEREELLQEVLVQFRGLYTLAVAKGQVDPSKNCIPWHMASAYRGANLLQTIFSHSYSTEATS